MLLAPAYNVTEEDVRYIVDTTAAAITRFFKLYSDRYLVKEAAEVEDDGIGDVA